MKSSFLSPAFSASVRPSAKLAIMLPITMLTTSFMLAPLPTCASSLSTTNRRCLWLAHDVS